MWVKIWFDQGAAIINNSKGNSYILTPDQIKNSKNKTMYYSVQAVAIEPLKYSNSFWCRVYSETPVIPKLTLYYNNNLGQFTWDSQNDTIYLEISENSSFNSYVNRFPKASFDNCFPSSQYEYDLIKDYLRYLNYYIRITSKNNSAKSAVIGPLRMVCGVSLPAPCNTAINRSCMFYSN